MRAAQTAMRCARIPPRRTQCCRRLGTRQLTSCCTHHLVRARTTKWTLRRAAPAISIHFRPSLNPRAPSRAPVDTFLPYTQDEEEEEEAETSAAEAAPAQSRDAQKAQEEQERQLSKKELKKKELEDLDAVFAELGINVEVRGAAFTWISNVVQRAHCQQLWVVYLR